MARTATRGLAEEELQLYRNEGYLIRDGILPPAKFDSLKEHFERRFAALAPGERPENMDVPHFTDTALFEWLLDDDVLDVVESIVGPDIALFTSHFFCKPAGDGKSVPWHTDAYFWRETIEPSVDALTIWLALDPATLENGCMHVLPGSHRQYGGKYRGVTYDGSVFDEELDPASVDASRAVPVELQPGQCSIHSAALVHGSKANTSSIRRCGFTMRYMSTHVRFNHENVGDRHQIYLARGKDHAGNVYGDPTRTYPELVENRGRGQRFVGKDGRRPVLAPGQG